MKLNVEDDLPISAERAFLLIRDEMPRLVPFLHDVESIVVTSRAEEVGTVRLVNLWTGSQAQVPASMRKFIKPELLSWNDHAEWTTETRSAVWRLEPRVGARIFECSGTTRLVEAGADRSRILMDIDLQIHAENVPGVPSFLGKRVRPQAEKLIAGLLTPNMRNLAVSIRAFAESEGL